jgi:hypothetical protein
MKLFLICCFLVLNLNCFSQPNFSESDAKDIIDLFFEGFHEGDTLKMSSVLMQNAKMQSTFSTKDGNQKISDGKASDFLKAIASRPEEQKWEELLLDYKVLIDGNLAQVWTPYEFWLNGNFSHCGANSFTLVNTDSGWKILTIIDSRRYDTCNPKANKIVKE